MGSMVGTGVQKDSFKQRLGRISSGGEYTNGHVHIGLADAASVKSKKSRRGTPRQGMAGGRRFLGELFLVPVALAAGAFSVLAARVISFRFLSDQSYYTAEVLGISGAMLGVAAIAIVLCVLLRVTLNLRGGSRGKAVLAGLLGMAFLENLVIVRAPELFAPLYSEAYVAEVVAKLGSTATF